MSEMSCILFRKQEKKIDSIHGTRAKMTCLIKAEHAATQLSNTLESRTLSQSF